MPVNGWSVAERDVYFIGRYSALIRICVSTVEMVHIGQCSEHGYNAILLSFARSPMTGECQVSAKL